jgi:hypothetical protein
MTINFNTEPYYDDYDAQKDFYRILFRPGYAVQARELTQLQTVMQSQISRFGDHVFKNGSQVIPGSVNVDNQIHFIKLDSTYNELDVFSFLTQFRDKIVTGATSGVKLRVIDTSSCNCVTTQTEIATLYCKIETTADDGETKRLIPGEEIVALEEDNQVATNYRLTEDQNGDITAKIRSFGDSGQAPTTYSGNASSDVLGFAYGVDVKEGVYYIDGFFVRNAEMHLYVGRFSTNPTCRVGFKVNEAVVVPEDDSSLLDNAQGSYNYAAPGAHRYQIALELVQLPLLSTDNIKFIELLRVVDGRVQQKITKSSYAELEKTFARRTYDESGNYEVNKFKLNPREHLDNGSNFGVYPEQPITPVPGVKYGDIDKFVMVVDPGKAYVQGYEIESVAAQYIEFNKARENSITGDEGNHIVRLDDQPIGTPVGNYVLITNLYKYPEINSFEQVYLVNRLNSTPGNSPSTTNIVGTARVKGIQLHSTDYSGGASATIYKLGLVDIKMYSGYSFASDVKQITGTGASGNIFTSDIYPELITITGSASSTSGSTAIVGVGTNFVDYGLKTGDVLYINGTRVGTVSTVNNNLSITLLANSPSTITGGIVQHFHTKLNEAENESLLYPIGYQFVKTLLGWDGSADTLNSSELTVRRVFSPMTAASNSVSWSLTDNNEFFTSDADLSNFLLINVTTNIAASITAGTITFKDGAGNVSTSIRKTVEFSGLTNGQTYILIASVFEQGTAGKAKTKTLTTTSDTITGKKSVTGNVIELTKADGYKLVSVQMTAGDYSTFNPSSYIDITDRFTLDDGQRSAYYTNAKLLLKAGYQVPNGAIKVTYQYFQVGGAGNYFSRDSYTIDYDDIPSYYYLDTITGKRKEIRLSDAVDFRPIIAGTNTWNPEIPKIGEDFVSPIAYYLGRQDKLVVDSVGRFNVIQGVPGLLPKEPDDPKEGMVLATVYVPPYTLRTDQIKVFQRDNRRYTMKDIGKLDRRITNLEYYVTLNLLEKDTATLQIKDATTGLDRFKNGFVVDQFTGHGIGDVKNEDYKIAVDSQTRTLRPMHFTTALEVVEDLASGLDRATVDYVKSNDIITLPYTETEYIFNPHSTRTIDVNPYKIGAFKGEIVLNPAGDNWKDTDRRPDLQVTDDNNYDAIKFMADQLGVTGTVWDEWQTNWTGSTSSSTTWQTGDPSRRRQTVTGYETTVTTDTGTTSREGIQTTLQSSVNTVDYGDRIIDIGFTPYMRARPVVYVAKNLKAGTRFFPFFDNISVDEYIKPADVFKVTKLVGSTVMSFAQDDMQNNLLADDVKRAYDGKIEPAFTLGEVLVNSTHTPTGITSINGGAALTGGLVTSFNIVVSNASGILPGHHVQLYNLDFHQEQNNPTLYDLVENFVIPASENITTNTATAKQLNLRKFKVTAVSGTTITLANINGGTIDAFSAYSTASYSGGSTGKLYRLKASAVVAYDGYVYESETNQASTWFGYPTIQDIHVVNIKNGFAVGETLAGTIKIGTSSFYNSVTLTAVNGNTTQTAAPTMKQLGDSLRTDVDGATIGTFFIPNNDTLSFRTGERTFKLIDNVSNSDADFDSKGSVVYYSQGMTLTKERTIVNTRTAEFVQDRLFEAIPVRRTTTSTRVLYSYWTGHDPIAQTFVISSTGGVFVTSVDVFFSEAGSRPVTVELRSTNNSVPSSKIIPMSMVTKTPQQINVSDDGSAATTFVFNAPIYLQDGETYALVIKTDEPGCQVHVSELGKTDLITDNVVTNQPLTGSLYLSQNSKEFEINPLLDLKFVLRKAVFDISASAEVLFRTNPPLTYKIDKNPLEITPQTTKVRVYAMNHGFVSGELVTLSGFAKSNYGTTNSYIGIPDTILNGQHTVLATGLEKDSFIIDLSITDGNGNYTLAGSTTSTTSLAVSTGSKTLTVGTNLNYLAGDVVYIEYDATNYMRGTVTAYTNLTGSLSVTATSSVGTGTYTSWKIRPDFVKGEYGGDTIYSTRGLNTDGVFLKTSDLNFQDTTLNYYVNTQDSTGTYTGMLPMVANSNFLFDTRKHIRSYDNQTVVTSSPLLKKSSLLFKAILTSTNNNVSPVIDLQKISAYSITNLINNQTHEDINVAEIDSRELLIYGNITDSDVTINGAGSISTSTSSTAVTGVSTSFLTQVKTGDILKTTGGTTIGTVSTVNSATSITLTGNAAVTLVGQPYTISSVPTLSFTNSGSYGVISTNIDTADNLLANAVIGKKIVIANAHSNVNGTYTVADVITSTDTLTYAGNPEQDKINVYVTPTFAGSASIDMITDNDFTIKQLDKYVEDFAPVGTQNYANYVTRTLTLATAAENIKIIFDASIVGSTDVKVYYRTWTGAIELRTLPYTDTGFVSDKFDAEGEFTERTIDVANIAAFNNVQIKVVMKSSDPTKVPLLKNLRLIATS